MSPMKNSFPHLLLFLWLVGGLRPATNAQNPSPKVLESTLASASLKKDLKLSVYLPEGYEAAKLSYPVLYVLHSHDKTMEETVELVKKMQQGKLSPATIVVGIAEGEERLNRFADNARYDSFLACLEREVLPAIEKQYRTNGQKIVYGQSLSGSFTLYAFLTKPTLFDGYIAATKQWYEKNNNYFIDLANQKLSTPGNFKGRKIFLASLNGAYNNNNIGEVDQQMAAFATLLENKSGGQVAAKYQAFDDWGISPQPGLKAGLLFVNKTEKTTKSKTVRLTMSQSANGKWVIMDQKKKLLYEVFTYDNGPDYASEGLIRIVKNGKIGYADATTYLLVIAPQFDCAFPFENGKAKVSNQCKTTKEGEYSLWTSDAWQYINKDGSR
jgi:predicted alpha/beta superfamily hydrolase